MEKMKDSSLKVSSNNWQKIPAIPMLIYQNNPLLIEANGDIDELIQSIWGNNATWMAYDTNKYCVMLDGTGRIVNLIIIKTPLKIKDFISTLTKSEYYYDEISQDIDLNQYIDMYSLDKLFSVLANHAIESNNYLDDNFKIIDMKKDLLNLLKANAKTFGLFLEE